MKKFELDSFKHQLYRMQVVAVGWEPQNTVVACVRYWPYRGNRGVGTYVTMFKLGLFLTFICPQLCFELSSIFKWESLKIFWILESGWSAGPGVKMPWISCYTTEILPVENMFLYFVESIHSDWKSYSIISKKGRRAQSVSYTHLTLPTIYSV